MTKDFQNEALNNNFSMDFINISAYQRKKNGQIHSGPGVIQQDKNGKLFIKIYHQNQQQDTSLPAFNQPEAEPGEIIEESHYFDILANDVHGREWSAKRLMLGGDISYPSIGRIVEGELSSFFNIEKRFSSKEYSATLYLKGELELPYRDYQKKENGGLTLNTLEFDTGKIKIKTVKNKDFTTISFSTADTSEDIKAISKKILGSFEIALGHLMENYFSFSSDNNGTKKEFFSSRNNGLNVFIPRPFESYHPHHAENFILFISKLLSIDTIEFNKIHSRWLQIYQGRQGGMASGSLSLCVSVEGLIKDFFSKKMKVPEEEKNRIDEALASIKKLSIDTRIKNRILGSLASSKNKSPKRIINEIIPEGSMVKKWGDLRNKSAHAETLKNDKDSHQKYVDEYYSTLTLFYLILYRVIDFRGWYSDRSTLGWPENIFNPTS